MFSDCKYVMSFFFLETKANAAKHMPSASVTQIGRQYHWQLACVVGVWENLIALTRQQAIIGADA